MHNKNLYYEKNTEKKVRKILDLNNDLRTARYYLIKNKPLFLMKESKDYIIIESIMKKSGYWSGNIYTRLKSYYKKNTLEMVRQKLWVGNKVTIDSFVDDVITDLLTNKEYELLVHINSGPALIRYLSKYKHQ